MHGIVLLPSQSLCCFSVDLKFVKLLQLRSKRIMHSDGLSDIFDGQVYKDFSDFFADEFAISVTLNYDGAPIFKSSGMQIWPVQLFINELSTLSRYALMHNYACIFKSGVHLIS